MSRPVVLSMVFMNGDVGVLGKAGELLFGVSTGVLSVDGTLMLKFPIFGIGRPPNSDIEDVASGKDDVVGEDEEEIEEEEPEACCCCCC